MADFDLGQVMVTQGAHSIRVGAANAITKGLRAFGEELPGILRDLERALNLKGIPRSWLESANLRVAESAQRAVVAQYESRLPRHSHPYRPVGVTPGRGRLVGRLGAALSSPSMTANTTDRVVSFVNTSVLNEEAEHWHRINYGTGALAEPAQSFPVTVGSARIGALRDPGRPAPYNLLPRFFVWGVADEFFPRSGPGEMRAGRGSRAAHYLDAGFEATAKGIGPAYTQMLVEYSETKRGQVRLRRHNINVQATLGGA